MLGAAAVAALAALGWAFAPRPVAVEVARAQTGRFEASIEEEGRTRIRDSYTVSAPVAGRLSRITLREGDPVAAGQVLAWLSPQMPSMQDARSLAEAQARLRATDAAVAVARAQLERSRVDLVQARQKLGRSGQLARAGFVAGSALEDDRLAVEAAQRELEAANGQLEMAQHERAQAAAALRPATMTMTMATAIAPAKGEASGAASARFSDPAGRGNPGRDREDAIGGPPLALRAPVEGVVLKVNQGSESTVTAGSAVLAIGDPRRMEVLVQMLTTDAVRALPGTAAVIEGWGGPPVAAKVRRVEPAAFTKVSALGVEEQRVNVLLDVVTVPDAWRHMGDGFRVLARVITASADGVVLVPVGALFPRPEGGMAVYRLTEDGRAHLQPVELGGRNARVGWVTSGLAAGQRVIVYPPAGVADGGRVRERSP